MIIGRDKERIAKLEAEVAELRALDHGSFPPFIQIDVADRKILVTPSNAGKSPTYLACIRLLSESVAQLPLHLYRRDADDGRERDREHSAAKLVQGRPNPWTSSFEFRRALTIDAIQKGGGFAIVVSVRGKPRELHRIDPDRVTIETDPDTGEPRYRLSRSRGGERIVPWGDMLHVPGIDGTEQKTGLPMLLNDAIATDIAMGRHQRSLFENGARPSGYLMPKRQLNKQALDNAISAFELQHSGPDNSGGTMVSPEEFTFEQLTFSSVDAEFSSCRRMAVEDVARGMGCPLPLVGSLDRATWRNVEELNRTFLTFGLMPWLLAWQGALARALLTAEEQETRYFEFIVDGVVKADIRSRYEAFYRATGGAAWLTPNEARGLENRPNIDGGDELRVPLNTAPASEPAQVEQEAEEDA